MTSDFNQLSGSHKRLLFVLLVLRSNGQFPWPLASNALDAEVGPAPEMRSCFTENLAAHSLACSHTFECVNYVINAYEAPFFLHSLHNVQAPTRSCRKHNFGESWELLPLYVSWKMCVNKVVRSHGDPESLRIHVSFR